MNQVSLFAEGINLLILGVGFVASFLTLLVGATMLLSSIAQKFVVIPVAAAPKPVQPAQPDQTELICAISAAIHHHNKPAC
ncbi:MAG: OadG family protein [Moritella sp.]|uniref:OadG family protein n=1 Tax=Moritella sp. TaxID=78556 RepID=UPI001D3DA8D9|nr:OadG family transporter subunit [Moritella sp.]NQZ48647.1 OadG family protein [Moritella sp.]